MIGFFVYDLGRYFFDSFKIFYTSLPFRWFVYALVFILNFFAFYQNPVLRTDSKKCYGMPCRWFSFITGICAMSLYLFGLIALWYVAPFSEHMPDYWYIPVIILTYAIITQITISIQVTEENGNFNPPPQDLWPKATRVKLYLLILLLDVIYFHQMYLDSGQALTANKRIVDDLILSRFGGTKNTLSFVLGWFGLVGLLFDFLSIRFISGFDACHYGLPKIWNF